MHLLPQESKILHCVQLDASKSVPQIAQETKLKEHVVRYYLKSLTDRGIITRYYIIDLRPLGFNDYSVSFSLSSTDKQVRESVVSEFIQNQQVSCLAEFGNDLQFQLTICARDPEDVQFVINGVANKVGALFAERNLSVWLKLTFFQRKYFSPDFPSVDAVSSSEPRETAQIELADHTLLSTLMSNPGAKIHDLMQTIGASESSVRHRLQKLHDQKIIVRNIYALNTQLLGLHCFRLLIICKGTSETIRDNIYHFCEQHPFITNFIQCLGSWDYEISIEVFDVEQVSAFIDDFNQKFGPQIQSVRVLPFMRRLKLNPYPIKSYESLSPQSRFRTLPLESSMARAVGL